ncbi:MAG: hypothetical protein K9N23_17605 [Akkermansiaceae bacterium]|nr:hypothetical protein [Akkermansiaceae bacterium]MCF7733509.1 hypothetical protein [Akkermansiaceae bacterium]
MTKSFALEMLIARPVGHSAECPPPVMPIRSAVAGTSSSAEMPKSPSANLQPGLPPPQPCAGSFRQCHAVGVLEHLIAHA